MGKLSYFKLDKGKNWNAFYCVYFMGGLGSELRMRIEGGVEEGHAGTRARGARYF
jgi:hypothetical protein